MSKYEYNPYPLGRVKKEHQRPELDMLLERGYLWRDAREVVDMFEDRVAEFFGSRYAVATDCCSHAIFLSLQYLKAIGEVADSCEITIPRHTYISVPMQILHCGLCVRYKDIEWIGYYPLQPTRVVDAAVIWERDSYVKNSLMCLSFQLKKAIPVGKMGTILTDDKAAHDWLKLASYDGRDLTVPYDSPHHVKMIGWHMYATPEDCARAILLMDDIGEKGKYLGTHHYPDVSQMIKNI